MRISGQESRLNTTFYVTVTITIIELVAFAALVVAARNGVHLSGFNAIANQVGDFSYLLLAGALSTAVIGLYFASEEKIASKIEIEKIKQSEVDTKIEDNIPKELLDSGKKLNPVISKIPKKTIVLGETEGTYIRKLNGEEFTGNTVEELPRKDGGQYMEGVMIECLGEDLDYIKKEFGSKLEAGRGCLIQASFYHQVNKEQLVQYRPIVVILKVEGEISKKEFYQYYDTQENALKSLANYIPAIFETQVKLEEN